MSKRNVVPIRRTVRASESKATPGAGKLFQAVSPRRGIEAAICAFGKGFLACASNQILRNKLRTGSLDSQQYYQQLIGLAYRLFLIVHERRQFLWREKLRGRGNAPNRDICSLLAGDPTFFANIGPDVEHCMLPEPYLVDAIRCLSSANDDRNEIGAELGSAYERLLELQPTVDVESGDFRLAPASGRERKTTGSYYTPPSLVQCLLDSTLDPVLDEAAAQDDPETAILNLKICDPACGTGHLLVAAARRMAKRLAQVRTGTQQPIANAVKDAIHEVIGRCIYGVDINLMAVELCKVALWEQALRSSELEASLGRHIRCGNSLIGADRERLVTGIPDAAFEPASGDDRDICAEWRRRNRKERRGYQTIGHGQRISTDGDEKLLADAWCAAFVCRKSRGSSAPISEGLFRQIEREPSAVATDIGSEVRRLASKYRFFHWQLEFTEVFARELTSERRGFDVILGNPPFINAIEGGIDDCTKAFGKVLHPRIGGTADLSYYFLDKSLSLVKETGRVGLIQPRAVLNAPSIGKLRGTLTGNKRPNMLYVPNRSDFFPGAAVFVCVVSLGPDLECRASRDDEFDSATWRKGRITDSNWWLAVSRILGDSPNPDATPGPTLGSMFEIAASMTAGDAYDLRPQVIDAKDGKGPKLVTTGLIEPAESLWGRTMCRYLKADFRFPRVAEARGLSASLRRRLANARRPKVLVAGLSRRVECFLDEAGDCVGAVSTFSIFHPDDDIVKLRQVVELLLSDATTEHFKAVLGGNAMGGGNTTMKRTFLERLVLPS